MGEPDWWRRERFGMLAHCSLASVPAWAPLGQDAGWYRAHVHADAGDLLLQPSPLVESLAHHRDRWAHIERYDDFAPFLTFDDFDPDEWTALARDAGMSYLVMTAKHHDGWCWWDAPGSDRTVLVEGPGRNVLGEIAAACERAELGFGTYYSLLDWADARYPKDPYVDEVVHPHVLDLVDRYGSRMLWGDGHWGGGGGHWRSDELLANARAIDPGLVANDRWFADSGGVLTYDYVLPDDVVVQPWEHRRGLGGSLGHNRVEQGEHLLSAHDIVSLLTEVVAKGGHLTLSVGPDASGRLPAAHAQRLREAGRWVRAHASLLADAEPWSTWGDASTRYLTVDGEVHAIDVSGRSEFPSLAVAAGKVTTVETTEGEPVAFEQTDTGLALRRPPERPHDLADVYRITLEPPPEAPIELFASTPAAPIELASVIGDASAGDIVQLGDGRYIGPARIPDGVTVRGLGPDRTTIDGIESVAVVLGRGARLEHCSVVGGGQRVIWLPKTVVRIAGGSSSLLGCDIDGHIDVAGDGAKVSSCRAAGLVAAGAERLTVTRSTFEGSQWDCSIDLSGGSGHAVESCELSGFLVGIRCTGTVGAVLRGNRIQGRWWAIQLVDTDGTTVIGNAIERTMRAIDVDGGTHAEVSGNAISDGDSGCVVQRGAADVAVAGNRWERCRLGLLAWDAATVRHHDNAAVDLTDAAVTVGP